jgi:hypothetical protein
VLVERCSSVEREVGIDEDSSSGSEGVEEAVGV